MGKILYLMKVILFQPQQDTISVKDSQSSGEATTPASCKGRVATYLEKKIVFNQFLTLFTTMLERINVKH